MSVNNKCEKISISVETKSECGSPDDIKYKEGGRHKNVTVISNQGLTEDVMLLVRGRGVAGGVEGEHQI